MLTVCCSSVYCAFSDSVQLLCGSIWLQPLPHSRPKIRLCVVWWSPGQLPVFKLLQWTCAADVPCSRHTLCEYSPVISGAPEFGKWYSAVGFIFELLRITIGGLIVKFSPLLLITLTYYLLSQNYKKNNDQPSPVRRSMLLLIYFLVWDSGRYYNTGGHLCSSGVIIWRYNTSLSYTRPWCSSSLHLY